MKDILLIGSRTDKLNFIQKLREQSCNMTESLMDYTGLDMYKLKIDYEVIRIWLASKNDVRLYKTSKVNIAILVSPKLDAEKCSAIKGVVVVTPQASESELQCVFRAVAIKPPVPASQQLIKRPNHRNFIGIIVRLLTEKTIPSRDDIVCEALRATILRT